MNPPLDNDWQTVSDRLRQAAQAIASSAGNLQQHEAVAMQARTTRFAQSPPHSYAHSDPLEIISFSLASESYALEARYVWEIMPVPQITPVPRTPEFLLGLINLRGEILAVFDLSRLLGLDSQGTKGTSRLFVLGEAHPQFGFVADAVEQIRTLDTTQLTLAAAPFGVITQELVRGITADAVVVLKGKALLSDDRLFIDQRDDSATI
jgi:purine-binding chemotaxis protein CheW